MIRDILRAGLVSALAAGPALASPETYPEPRWESIRLSAQETGMGFEQAGLSYGDGGYDQPLIATCTGEAPAPEVALLSLESAPGAADDGRAGLVVDVDGVRWPLTGQIDPQDPARVTLEIEANAPVWQALRRGGSASIVFDGGAIVPMGLSGSGRAIGVFLDACRSFAAATPDRDDLASRVLGWAPEGEGLSGPDGVMVALGGRWRQVDDPLSEIVIDPFGPNGPTHAFVYGGTAEDPEPAGFGNAACEGPLAEGPLGYFAVGAEDPLCYGIDRLTEDSLTLTFLGARLNTYRFERVSDAVELPAAAAPASDEGSCAALGGARSEAWDAPVSIRVTNEGAEPLEVFWIDYDGARQPAGAVMPGEAFEGQTFLTHPFEFRDASGACVGIVLPEAGREEHSVEE